MPAAVYSSMSFCLSCSCVKPPNGIRTLGSLSSGVIFTPSSRNSAMLSACVSSVPLATPGSKPSRSAGAVATNSSGVRAAGLNASILPRSDLNSATVSSLVRHSARAARTTRPRSSISAGRNGSTHVAASGVTRMSVVVARSFCECRQTSARSFVNVTSHSSDSRAHAIARLVGFLRVLGETDTGAAMADRERAAPRRRTETRLEPRLESPSRMSFTRNAGRAPRSIVASPAGAARGTLGAAALDSAARTCAAAVPAHNKRTNANADSRIAFVIVAAAGYS